MQLHPNSYFPDWDLRLSKGDQAEALVAAGLEGQDYEVKFDSYAKRSGKVYVEFEQFRQGAWHPSGVSISKSDRYAFVVDHATGAFVSVPTPRLRQLAEDSRQRGDIKQTRQTSAQDNGKWPPTRGALVSINNILGVEQVTS